MLGLCLTFYHHVVYINLNDFSQLWLKHSGHHPLVDSPYILQTKWHYLVMVIPNRSNKSRPLLIVQSQGYLVVALESVQKTHPMMAYSGIHQPVYPRHENGVF